MQWTLNGASKLVPQLVQRRLAESTNFMLAPFQQTVPAQNTNVITSNFSNTGTGAVTPLTPNQ